MQQQVLFLL